MAEKIEIPCSEPGCTKKVTYEREVVHGFRTGAQGSKHVSVYLTCANDHTRKYVFDVPA